MYMEDLPDKQLTKEKKKIISTILDQNQKNWKNDLHGRQIFFGWLAWKHCNEIKFLKEDKMEKKRKLFCAIFN